MDTALPETAAAQQQLRKLYDRLAAEEGHPPSFDCFYPVNVERLIAEMEWRIEVVEVPAYVGPLAQAHALSDPEAKTIFLAKSESGDRRRFTLAHELGHILLHPGLSRARSTDHPRSVRRGARPSTDLEWERLEVEANKFAAQLLMPAKAVRRQVLGLFGVHFVIPQEAARLLHSDQARDRTETARRLSRWESPNQQSICSTFGVSPHAAGLRLLELDLV